MRAKTIVVTSMAMWLGACSSSSDSEATTADTGSGADGSDGSDGTDGTDGAADVVAPKDISTPKDVVIALPDTSIGEDVVALPAATCREAVMCQYACSLTDSACRDACTVGVAEDITTRLTTLNTCLSGTCQAQTSESVSQCWLDQENCYDEFAGCFFDGKAGATNCEDTSKCYAGCKASKYAGLWNFDDVSPVAECEDGCLQAADGMAQYRLLGWALCVAQFCNSNESLGEDCEKNAPCGTQRELCISPQ